MKYSILLFLIASVVLVKCGIQPKVIYEFPGAMAEPVRAEFRKACDKGKILYQINCAGCHTIKKGKREFIPDFTADQLKGYELRVSNAEHEKNMPDELVTAEELGLISTFLLYKKKSGIGIGK